MLYLQRGSSWCELRFFLSVLQTDEWKTSLWILLKTTQVIALMATTKNIYLLFLFCYLLRELYPKYLLLLMCHPPLMFFQPVLMTRPLTPYYEKCFSVLTTLRGIVSRQEWQDFVFSSKRCYSALLRKNSTSPILHRFWSSFLPIDFDLDLFWDYVQDGFSENYKNDILWLIVLKKCVTLKNWGYIDSNKRASCSRKETIDHCFLNCVRVKRVWSLFLSCPLFPSW